nr:U5 small nuclear ribonucleoprotein 40kDa subunit [Cryptomonas curvata]
MYIKLYYKFSNIVTCCFSQNGQQFACGDEKGVLSLWNLGNIFRNPTLMDLHSSSLDHMLFHSSLLFTGFFDGTSKIIDFCVCKTIRTLKSIDFNRIYDLDCNKEITMILNNTGTVKFWDNRSKHPIESITHGTHIQRAQFSQKPFVFFTAGILPEIFIWDIRKIEKKKARKFKLNEKKFQINSLVVSKKNKFLFISDIENNYFQYYINFPIEWINSRRIQNVPALSKNFSEKYLKISCDIEGNYIGYGNQYGNIFIWSQKTGKIIYNIKDHYGKVNQVNFHPNNKIFCSCAKDNNVIIRKFHINKTPNI